MKIRIATKIYEGNQFTGEMKETFIENVKTVLVPSYSGKLLTIFYRTQPYYIEDSMQVLKIDTDTAFVTIEE